MCGASSILSWGLVPNVHQEGANSLGTFEALFWGSPQQVLRTCRREAEAQRGEVSRPRSHSLVAVVGKMVETDKEPGVCQQACVVGGWMTGRSLHFSPPHRPALGAGSPAFLLG